MTGRGKNFHAWVQAYNDIVGKRDSKRFASLLRSEPMPMAMQKSLADLLDPKSRTPLVRLVLEYDKNNQRKFKTYQEQLNWGRRFYFAEKKFGQKTAGKLYVQDEAKKNGEKVPSSGYLDSAYDVYVENLKLHDEITRQHRTNDRDDSVDGSDSEK